MVVFELDGRIGNQMFQYALGLIISNSRTCKFYLYIDKKKNNTNKLGCFFLSTNSRKSTNLIGFIFRVSRLIYKISTRFNLKFNFFYYKEETYDYNLGVFNNRFLFYSGYFQSEKYFKNKSSIIRECFKFKETALKIPFDFLKKINSSNSISIHIRRGDYVTCDETNKIHGVLDLNYYYNAIKYISKHVNNPTFFIFSDDISWVKINFKISFPYSLSENNSPETDLYLMSKCKHNIIANSSFSWWGAWLNNNIEKVVCAPQFWFKNNRINYHNLEPNHWLKISNSLS